MLKHIRLIAAIALVSFAAMQTAPAMAEASTGVRVQKNMAEKEQIRKAQEELARMKLSN